MTYEKMATCADLNLASAIEDLAIEEHIEISEARKRLLGSRTYTCLYNFDSGLWMEGPDYIRYIYHNWE